MSGQFSSKDLSSGEINLFFSGQELVFVYTYRMKDYY